MARPPPLEPIVAVGPHDLNLTIVRDHSPSATPAASTDIPKSPQTAPLLESSRQSSQKYVSSSSRRRQASRRQSSISYLPADSPRLWTPRTPHLGLDTFERASLSVPIGGKRTGHVRTVSVPQRAASESMGLTLAERHADLLQCIAQKESKCLELRSQLAIHESELLELKRKWERIVHCEFGHNTSPTSAMVVPSAAALANTSSAVVFNGLVGGVRALAAVTTSPPLPASVCRARARASSSSTFAKRVTRQNASNSISSTTTTATTASSSAHGTDSDSPRLSQSSMSSVAEEKPNLDKAEEPVEEVLASSPGSVAVEKRGLMSSDQSPSSPSSSSSKTVRRRSCNSRVAFADALRPLTGDKPRSSSGKRASVSVASPTSSVSIPAISPLSAMGLGRANLGETAQGWVDSVGSKLVELQRGQTFSKGQKRASVLLSDVSQSILSALGPVSSVNSSPVSAPPAQSLIDEDDDAGSTALGSAILPDVLAASTRTAPSKTLPPPTPEVKEEEEEEDWNW